MIRIRSSRSLQDLLARYVAQHQDDLLPCVCRQFLPGWGSQASVPLHSDLLTIQSALPRLLRSPWAATESLSSLKRHYGEDIENRIKECQLDLFADRTSAATMRANQLRLWFASMAYVLLCALRRIGLAYTQFADATCGTIRLKLLKIGALVRISVRRIKVAMASACPFQDAFALAHVRLSIAAA
jgi:hypothetical protein